MEEQLSDIVLQMKQAIARLTSNETLAAFNDDYCRIIDSCTDEFVINRKKSCIKLLKKIFTKFEYDETIKQAYDDYNEAITYIDLKKKCNIHHITETKKSTPDFIIRYDDKDIVYIELKSLAFAEGNSIYKKSQDDALEGNISVEKKINYQVKNGQTGILTAWTEREVLPLGTGGLTIQLKRVIEKIDNNYKPDQYKMGDTILAVDLNQLFFSRDIDDTYAIRRSFNHIGYCSGSLWTLAFGEFDGKFYEASEFEGKQNIIEPLGFEGVLKAHNDIKGVIFIVGGRPNERFFYGFYRSMDQDLPSVKLIQKICTAYNDELDSKGPNNNIIISDSYVQ